MRVDVGDVGFASGRVGRTGKGDEVVAVMVSNERYSLSVNRRERVADCSEVLTGDFEDSDERRFDSFRVPFVEGFRIPID